MNYEQKVRDELARWEAEILQADGLWERLSRRVQQRVDKLIPEKVHQALAKAMEVAVRSVLTGIDMLPFSEAKLREYRSLSLVERDFYFDKLSARYKKLAAAEGVGTGAGGIVLAAVDYPALLTIKLKFLSETAQIYGCDIREFGERLFLLRVFQLAYSNDSSRKRVFQPDCRRRCQRLGELFAAGRTRPDRKERVSDASAAEKRPVAAVLPVFATQYVSQQVFLQHSLFREPGTQIGGVAPAGRGGCT